MGAGNREGRRAIAEETAEILRRGGYTAPDGTAVDLSGAMARALASVRCVDAASLGAEAEARGEDVAPSVDAEPVVDVVAMTTLAGAKDLLERGAPDVCCLNFASARRAGGGYLSGAQAQEEALARASGLVPALETATAFYRAHRDAGSALYSDAIAFVDHAPVFRDDDGVLVAEPWSCAFVSAAAPNVRALRDADPALLREAPQAYRNRVTRILEACRVMGRRTLVLGAWGCGVFGNEPRFAAEAFRSALASRGVAGAFDRVRFAIHDPGNTGALDAFVEIFAAHRPV